MKALLAIVALGAVCLYATASSAAHPEPRCSATQFRDFSSKVWDPSRWRRERPTHGAISAQRRRLSCAGSQARRAMQHRWRSDRRAFYVYRREMLVCARAPVVVGRVSYFGGGLMASGHYTSEPAIALNIAPGTESGWDNATTRGWLAALQHFRVTIAGHSAVLFLGDLGPAGFTQRAIDVTEGGVSALGLSGAFPTDASGRAKLLPPGCA